MRRIANSINGLTGRAIRRARGGASGNTSRAASATGGSSGNSR
jgi:hypothetical protein